MRLSQLIKKLQDIKAKRGDLPVESFVNSGSASVRVSVKNHIEGAHDGKIVYIGPR
jgi:hypothetical protein